MDDNMTDFEKLVLQKYDQMNKELEESRKCEPKVNTKNPQRQASAGKQNFRNRKRPFNNVKQPFQSITESEVGICQFLSDIPGFKGIIKHRFSDFQVNEIDLEGNVVELTSTKLPLEVTTSGKNESSSSDQFNSVLSIDDWNKIDLVLSSKNTSDSHMIDVTEKTKEDRGIIHRAIKGKYESKISSNTKDIGDKKFIEVKKQIKPDLRWPSDRGGFLHATLFKVNMDMTEVLHILIDKLRVRSKGIGFCGTKDKRSKSSQRISIKKRTANSLMAVKHPQLKFGNFEYRTNELKLGDLYGNKFSIAIRNVTESKDIIDQSLNFLKENGFINYFGLQRFGFASTPTYSIGKALLSSDWKKAIELILKPRNNMEKQKELSEALKQWWTSRNAEEVVNILSKNDNSIEAKVIRTLNKEGNECYMNALFALPRNTMTMYMHAYQSLIWNKIVSKRIEKFGMKPLAGDLIVVEGSVDKLDADEGCEAVIEEDEETDEVGDNGINDDAQQKSIKRGRKSFVKVRTITAEECETTPLDKVVYPLPGHDIQYPDNEVAKWYSDILAEDNFTFDDFKNSHKHFALSGAYRAIVAKPENITWEIVEYGSQNDDLILSDLDKMNDVKLNITSNDNESKFTAVLVTFNLKSCCYATMALREVMKCETSVYHQAKLTMDHNTQKRQKLSTDNAS